MPIEKFPLSWRWTNKSHAELPEEDLAKITPIDQKLASELFDAGSSVIQERSSVEASVDTAGSEETIRAWLRRLPLSSASTVTIVWSKQLGVRLPWGIFVDYWSDFCYPSSDEAFVFLEDGSCALSYDHSEQFRYTGVRNPDK